MFLHKLLSTYSFLTFEEWKLKDAIVFQIAKDIVQDPDTIHRMIGIIADKLALQHASNDSSSEVMLETSTFNSMEYDYPCIDIYSSDPQGRVTVSDRAGVRTVIPVDYFGYPRLPYDNMIIAAPLPISMGDGKPTDIAEGVWFVTRLDGSVNATILSQKSGMVIHPNMQHHKSYRKWLRHEGGTRTIDASLRFYPDKKGIFDFNEIYFLLSEAPDQPLFYHAPAKSSLLVALFMALRAVGIINCKNVKTTQAHLPKSEKKKLRKNDLPIRSYWTLQLEVSPSGGSGRNGTGSRKRIHLCRGHFKVYTEDKPLLGRHVGAYWWQPHVRGNNKKGKVVKDYQL